MKFLKLIYSVCLITFLSSCAGGYKLITPAKLIYSNKTSSEGIDFSFKYDVLKEVGNFKYAKKETKKAVKLVAIKIINNTNQALTFGDNYKIFSGNSEAIILSTSNTFTELKQSVPIYLLYLLLSGAQFNTTSNGYVTSSFPVGLIIGPGIAGGNMLVASGANGKFKEELEKFSLLGKKIQSGETVYGLVGLRDTGYNPLSLKLVK